MTPPPSDAARLQEARRFLHARRFDEAAALLAGDVPADPAMAAVHWELRATLAQARGQDRAALDAWQRALALAPGAVAYSGLGTLQLRLGRAADALDSFDAAIALQPARPELLLGRARALFALHRLAAALTGFERVLALQPGSFAALVGAGNCLTRLRRPAEALARYDAALALQPDAAELHNNRGAALRELKRYADAAEAFDRLLSARPGYPYAASNRLHSRLYACDWRDHARDVSAVVAAVRAGAQADVPFSFLAISDDAQAQWQCAQRYVSDYFPPWPAPADAAAPAPDPGGRIRVAYLSADFHEHATSYLMAGLLEAHDRTRFALTALSFGPDADDAMRRRLLGCFDEFIDARNMGDAEAAALLRARGIDIAVDLKGFTTGNRAGILARRAAPVQVSFLGYPGTMGAPYMDYLLADAVVAPTGHQPWYSECLVHLPGSYQPNDPARAIDPATPSREACGLPAAGFVFCCFNNSYKLTPTVFAAWMRLLHAVHGSVLWLIDDNADASAALRAEAARAGIDPARLVFAPRLPLPAHLARHRLADLFLDTAPCNAHTTASDALWAGLPVLTCPGGAFAARVAASLLHAAGLPELVCADLRDYESRALALATEPGRLARLRERLRSTGRGSALFDTDRFRHALEQAYAHMHARRLQGLPPAPFMVEGAPGHAEA